MEPVIAMEERVIERLSKLKLTISAAESCTGGLFAATLVNVPGASYVLNQSYITYSNDAKKALLGVKKKTLKKHGAVAKKTAKEMCYGVAKAAKADVGVGITGIAGPDGGTKEKPVGLVYIGCYYNKNIVVKPFYFKGTRLEVRKQAVSEAMKMVYKMLCYC